MIGNEPQVGDRVHHEDRKHPSKPGWMQANGSIVNIIGDDDEREFVVEFGEDSDIAIYFLDQLEWAPYVGGYWRVVT